MDENDNDADEEADEEADDADNDEKLLMASDRRANIDAVF